MENSSNKRLAKNTLFLYIRMILIMLVSLYTSRIVLEALGVNDYGVYNVVGGVVTLLGVLSGSLASATSRYITFELGHNNEGSLKQLFRCCVTVHYILGIAILILAETVGLWFVINKLVIPPDRLVAAVWVYEFCLNAVVIKIVRAPYNALIIAYERMNAFALISVFEVLLQLGLVFILLYIDSDRLIIYGVSLAVVQILIRIIYNLYCLRHFPITSGKWLWDKALSYEIMKYSLWSLLGYGAVVGYTQGINILLNIFFGPVANAARGFSVQVQSGVNQISTNFQLALRPSTIKSYAQENYSRMHSLMYANAKFSYYLVLFMVVPLFINTPYIMKLWLVNVPEYTVSFTRILLPIALYTTLNGHVITAVHATGNIKKFQIVEALLLLTTLPIAYVMLKFWHISANTVLIIYMAVEFCTQFVRVWIVYPMVQCRRRSYFTRILYPVAKVTLPIAIYCWYMSIHYSAVSITELVLSTLCSSLVIAVAVYAVGLNNNERTLILQKTKSLLFKRIKK